MFVCSLAVVGSLVLTLLVGPVLHRLALPVAETWGLLGLQLITAAAFASAMALAAGRWALVPTWVLFIVLGNTSSGGAVSPPLLPPLFALISQWLPSGATVTALRDAVYFHSYQQVQPVAVSVAWAVGCLGILVVLAHRAGMSPGGGRRSDMRDDSGPAGELDAKHPLLLFERPHDIEEDILGSQVDLA